SEAGPEKRRGRSGLADLLQAVLVHRSLALVRRRAAAECSYLLRRQRLDDPCGRADDQRVFRELLALGDDGADSNHAAAADLGALHQDPAHADQDFVFHRATMQYDLMPDGAVLADVERKAGIDMAGRVVLDVGALTDVDPVIVPAQHR